MDDRLRVTRTAKLFIGGAFPRSESGLTYEVVAADGTPCGRVSRASRKDARDAVAAARAALPRWAGATAYNRGQVLYRVAELLEGRAAQLAEEVATATGVDGHDEVARSVDRLVWYAGWTDKISTVDGGVNAVAGPFHSWTAPTPVGVVAAFAPETPALLGLVDTIAPVLATGSTVVCVTSYAHPLPAVSLSEVLAAADVPAGTVNLLTGDRDELAPRLASHRDVDALDLAGFAGADTTALEVAAVDAMTRVRLADPADADRDRPPSPRRMLAFTEPRTVWHPVAP